MHDSSNDFEGVAIICMNGKFPGAPDVPSLWNNLKNGVCSITPYGDGELINAGVDLSLLTNPHYIKAGSHLERIDQFDASFFGYTPREAECMDPQHRLFLECAWETFELSGYNPDTYKGLIGLFAGSGNNSYLLKNLACNSQLMQDVGEFQLTIDNEKDYFTTRVSYKLNLKGPSVNVQSACSTSLVAICLGYQNLITYQCDMALCGGASLIIPHRQGYLYKEGFIFSPEGICRAFDAAANGTVQGEGVGLVLLKRMEDAIRDGDHIHAVIKGAALNNDGSLKAGYTAPSVDGQAQAIALAQELADVHPDTITYIETHGTGTPLGDPIEIAGLTKAFRTKTNRKNYCAIGSIKTNVGHLDAAAGVTGLIKAALAIENSLIPPSLNFTEPNPKLNLESSPFYVNIKPTPWIPDSMPKRAGVSSFGIGGTNAHVILQEAPPAKGSTPADAGWKILTLSAKSEKSLSEMKQNLANHLENNPQVNLDDAAFTLQVGRKLFDNRFAVIARSNAEATNAIESSDPRFIFSTRESSSQQPVIFMFTGQGSQFPGMTSGLYLNEPEFKKELDICAELLKPHLGRDLRDILYPTEPHRTEAEKELSRTAIVQPALFAIEYALTRFWQKKGITPETFIGHSVGEYVAACLAGVFSLEDGLKLITLRGRLMQSLPAGSMLSVPLSYDEVLEYLEADTSIAAINGPKVVVASGPTESIKRLEKILADKNITCRMLNTSHAFHSPMMEPICDTFLAELKKIKLNPPIVRYISNVTGTWIAPEDAINPAYWVRHLREAVNFNKGIETLTEAGYRIMLEIGPGNVLCLMAKRILAAKGQEVPLHIISTIEHQLSETPDTESIAKATAKLLIAGAALDMNKYYENKARLRIPLPTYAFDRASYWIDPIQLTTKDKKDQDFSHQNMMREKEPISGNIVATLNPIEQKMLDIWCEFFGMKTINPTDNFFELGGDSLKATQLISMINNRFHQDLTLANLIKDPTVRGISRLTKLHQQPESATTDENEIVPILFHIQPKGNNPTLFIVAGAHENRYFNQETMKSSYEEDFLRYLSQIIPHIGMDQPIAGFRPKGLTSSETPHRSVEEMATAYIKEMRKFQPEGPYLLAGECVGGIVAYEMAQQLMAAGQKVSHLILMDTHCPTPSFYYRMRYESVRDYVSKIKRSILNDLSEGGLSKLISTIQSNLWLVPVIATPITRRLWSLRQLVLRTYNYQFILLKYRTKPYQGDTTLFINEDWYSREPELGWDEAHRKAMTIVSIPGKHETRLTVHGETFGKLFRDLINKSINKYR